MRFTWYKPIIVFFTTGITYLVLTLVCAMIPAEQVPRMEPAANGTTVYIIQSLREAVSWPLGFVLFFALIISFSVYYARSHPVTANTNPSWFTSCLARTVTGAIALAFLIIIVFVVVVIPYLHFRKATVGPQTIELSSLYRTWTIKPSDVQDVAVIQQQDKSQGERRYSLRLRIATTDNTYSSIEIASLDPSKPELNAYRDVFDALAAAIKGDKKKALAK